MKKITTLLLLWIIITIVVTIISFIFPEFLNTIPSLAQLFWTVAYIITIIYIINMWIKRYASIINMVIKTILFLFVIPIVLLTSSLLIMLFIPARMFEVFSREVIVEQETLRIYENHCFIPDSRCECDMYYSKVYIKNRYLPIMHYVTKTDYFIGNIQIENGELILEASNDCYKDNGKIKIVKL